MNRGKLHHYWRYVRSINLLVLALLFATSMFVSIWLLRRNNLLMVEMRNAVVAADEQGGDTQTALQELRSFVSTHMNTDLRSNGEFATDEPPIQLVNAYNRAVSQAQEQVAASRGDAALYANAQADCEARGLPITVRAQCVQDYIIARTPAGQSVNFPDIPKELYTFDFVSPVWSPDLAGFSVVATTVIGILLLFRTALEVVVRRHPN